MNEKPLMGSDAQAQPAPAETASPAAFAMITSGARRVREALSRVIVGQNQAIDLALVTLLAGGHALIEGVPGVGKTLLVKALARTVAGACLRCLRNAKPDRASGNVSTSGGPEGPLSRKNPHGLSGGGRRERTGAVGSGRSSAGAPAGGRTTRTRIATGRTRAIAGSDGACARQRGGKQLHRQSGSANTAARGSLGWCWAAGDARVNIGIACARGARGARVRTA